MRLSRGCYDKFWRCPGWAGGGPKYAKRHRCNNGRIQVNYDDKFWPCNTCDVVVWPYRMRYLSPFWLWYELKWEIRTRKYNRSWKRK